MTPTAARLIRPALFAWAASLGDLEVWVRYPHREAGERVVMFHQGLSDAAAQVAEMDKHLTHLEEVLGRPFRGKAHWIRGTIWGRGNAYFGGLAMSDPRTYQHSDDHDPVARTGPQ